MRIMYVQMHKKMYVLGDFKDKLYLSDISAGQLVTKLPGKI